MGILLTADCAGNRIMYNEVRRTCLETGDTGGIYAYSVNKLTDPNVIEGNLVVDSVGMGTTKEGKIVSPNYSWGIYIDGESSNFRVRKNIVVRNVLGGVFFNGGHDNIVENNILVDGSQSQVWYSDYANRGLGNIFRRNIVVWSDPLGKLGLADTIDAAHLDADNNVYWHGGLEIPELAARQARGLELRSVMADPLFIAPTKENFGLQATSPAWKLGFEPIDVGRIGVKGYPAPPGPL
jgi:parallel beta-helix repeat protein